MYKIATFTITLYLFTERSLQVTFLPEYCITQRLAFTSTITGSHMLDVSMSF